MGNKSRSAELKTDVGRRLRVTRLALGMAQNEFAARAGIAANTYSMYESGDQLITVENALAMCEAHGLTMDWLYRGIPGDLPHKLATAVIALLDVQ